MLNESDISTFFVCFNLKLVEFIRTDQTHGLLFCLYSEIN